MEDTRRTRQRDPRLHRDLAQHQETPQRPEHAHTQRIREPTPTTKNRRLIPDLRLQESRVRAKTPSKPARLTAHPPALLECRSTSGMVAERLQANRRPHPRRHGVGGEVLANRLVVSDPGPQTAPPASMPSQNGNFS